MKTKKPLFILLIILSALSLIGTFMIYPNLPAEIAVHFNIAGEPDRFGPKSMIFITGALPLLMILLFVIIPKIDPRGRSYEKHQGTYTVLIFFITLFLIGIHWMMALIALGFAISVEVVVPIGTGLLFIVIGNYLPRVHSNYTLGIRTPWALEDISNWKKTQRIGGYMFSLSGLIIIIASLFVPDYTFVVILVTALLSAIVPFITSYMAYKKDH